MGHVMETKTKRLPTEVRRQQIAQAALTIIASHGLGRFTTSAIAKETGLAEGTIFRHFANKEAIVDAAIDMLESFLAPDFSAPPFDDPLLELRAFLAKRVASLKEKPGYLRILLSSELEHAAFANVRDRIMSVRERSVKRVASIVKRAITAGSLRQDVPPETIVMVVHGMLMAMVFNGDILGERLGFDLAFDTLWANIQAMIVPSSPAAIA